jgi:cyclopropane-fatty-acyl-phospholipid synthase
MGEIVGPTGRVRGVDISPVMVDRSSRRNPHPWISFGVGDATNLPEADAAYDVVISVQVAEYVADIAQFCREAYRVLKPGGRACVQSITIDDRFFERYLQSTDFIQQYIFPGGCLPSPSEFRKQAQAAGLQVVDELNFGPDYAETLRRWRESFMAQLDEVRTLKFDDRFIRLWEFYLAYCEAAFDEANIDVIQFTLAKPV